jgi:hypothetical protein
MPAYGGDAMLRVNVGLSKKLSKNYNSTGYSVNIDGEVTAPPSDPEAVVEQVKEMFDLAEEVLDQQIDRSRSVDAMASRDEAREESQPAVQGGNGSAAVNGNGTQHARANGNANGNDREEQPTATNKQVQYLLSIGKRQRLSTAQLEKRVEDILGRPVGIYDLSKQAAGLVIDALTNNAAGNGAGARR